MVHARTTVAHPYKQNEGSTLGPWFCDASLFLAFFVLSFMISANRTTPLSDEKIRSDNNFTALRSHGGLFFLKKNWLRKLL
jgi:hypothetical protein